MKKLCVLISILLFTLIMSSCGREQSNMFMSLEETESISTEQTYMDSTHTDSANIESVYTAEQIYDMAKNCVVEIVTYNRNGNTLAVGSGFVCEEDGKIVTNYHVIEGAYSADVYIENTKYKVDSVLAYDIDRDMAVLKIPARNLSMIKICTSDIKTGSTVYALGSSRGLTSTFSRGIITSSQRVIDGVIYIQHDAAISNGNSGGPLINEHCEIIGINTLTIKDSQNLNFAISTTELKKLSYGQAKTLQEISEKECNAFLKTSDFIKTNGEYSAEHKYYYYHFGETTKDGVTFARGAFYYPETGTLAFSSLMEDFLFSIDIIGGGVSYVYILSNSSMGYYMSGEINPQTFSSSVMYLSYKNTNLNSSMITSWRKLAASSANLQAIYFNKDLSIINVTAWDLGFINY